MSKDELISSALSEVYAEISVICEEFDYGENFQINDHEISSTVGKLMCDLLIEYMRDQHVDLKKYGL